MALTDQVIMPGSDYQAICDATRSLTGNKGTLKSGNVSSELRTVTPKTEMWILNGEGTVPKDMRFNVDFVSKDKTTKFISIARIDNHIYYVKADKTSVSVAVAAQQISETEFRYEWGINSGLSQMIFPVPPHGELLTWLQQNAKKVTSSADTNLKDEISFAPSLNGTTLDYSVTYNVFDGIKKITVAGVPTETKTVDLSMTSGDQKISSSIGKYMTSVTVKKPSTLIPSNIKKGVSIGGVVGAIPEIATDSLLDGVLTHNGALNIAGDTATLNVYITLDPHATLAEGHMILSELGNTIKPVTVPTEIVGITPTWTVSSSSTSYNPTSGRLIRSVVVDKPSTLISSNIKKGVEIGGIAGTYTGDDVFIREVSTVNATTRQGVITFKTSSLARYLYAFVISNGINCYASADIRSISSWKSILDNEGLSITRTDGSYRYSWSIFNSEELEYDGANMTVYIIYD